MASRGTRYRGAETPPACSLQTALVDTQAGRPTLARVFVEYGIRPTSFEAATDRHGHKGEVERGMAILEAAAEDVEGGYLVRVEDLVAADVFADFLDQAEHLLEAGYKDPAATLAGAVLEDGLRRLLSRAGESTKPRDDLSALNSRCAQKGLYNRLVQKKLSVWIDVRNNAAHGRFGEYNNEDVERMIEGINSFLADHGSV